MGKRVYRPRRFLGPSEGSEAIARLFMIQWADLLRELAEICWKRRRMRCRRLTMYSYDPKRPQGSLWTTNGQGSTGAAAKAHSRVGSRELKKIIFRPPVSVPSISLDH